MVKFLVCFVATIYFNVLSLILCRLSNQKQYPPLLYIAESVVPPNYLVHVLFFVKVCISSDLIVGISQLAQQVNGIFFSSEKEVFLIK